MSKEAIYYVSEPKEVDVPVKKYMCMVKYVDADGNYKTKTIPATGGKKPSAKKYNQLKAHSLSEARKSVKGKKPKSAKK